MKKFIKDNIFSVLQQILGVVTDTHKNSLIIQNNIVKFTN